MNARSLRILFLLLGWLGLGNDARAQAIGLDRSFGNNGVVTTDFEGDIDSAGAILLLPDGKLLLAGTSVESGNLNFALAQYNSDGRLDATFGVDGLVIVDLMPDDRILGIALQADGKIIGIGFTGEGIAIRGAVAVARFNADGTLDSSFGADGIVTTDIGLRAVGMGIALQPDGKIVVAGITGSFAFAVLRYCSDGSLDTGFDGDGIVVTNFTGNDFATCVKLQSGGKLLVGGSSLSDFAVARYNAGGSLDTSFGINGLVTTHISASSDLVTRILLQDDGNIIAAGHAGPFFGPFPDFAAVRYAPDGSLDPSFGIGGVVTTDIANSPDQVTDALITDGKILLAGPTGDFLTSDFAMVRLNSDGSPDTAFAGNGQLTTDLGMASADINNAMIIQSDGRIILAGSSNAAGTFDFAMARYIFVGSPPSGLPGGTARQIPTMGSGEAALLALLLGWAGLLRLLKDC